MNHRATNIQNARNRNLERDFQISEHRTQNQHTGRLEVVEKLYKLLENGEEEEEDDGNLDSYIQSLLKREL